MSSPHLVGLCGNAGVGKNTFAEEFHSYRFREYSFAGPVKQVCCAAFGLDPYYFTSRDLKEEEHPYWGFSPRKMAQLVGTELFRKEFGPNFWIQRLELSLIADFASREEVQAVITDVRFQNEAQWILDQGGILVHLTRPEHVGNVGIAGHASEAGIQFEKLTYHKEKTHICVANIGSKLELQKKAVQFIESIIS